MANFCREKFEAAWVEFYGNAYRIILTKQNPLMPKQEIEELVIKAVKEYQAERTLFLKGETQ